LSIRCVSVYLEGLGRDQYCFSHRGRQTSTCSPCPCLVLILRGCRSTTSTLSPPARPRQPGTIQIPTPPLILCYLRIATGIRKTDGERIVGMVCQNSNIGILLPMTRQQQRRRIRGCTNETIHLNPVPATREVAAAGTFWAVSGTRMLSSIPDMRARRIWLLQKATCLRTLSVSRRIFREARSELWITNSSPKYTII